MLIGLFDLRSSSLLLSLVALDHMEPLVDVDRSIRSSLVFASLVACRSRPHGPFTSSLLLSGGSHSQPSLGLPLRLPSLLKSGKKKSLILVVCFFFLSPGSCWFVLLFVRLVLSCVLLSCLDLLFVLTGSVKSSGLRGVFGRVVFLC